MKFFPLTQFNSGPDPKLIKRLESGSNPKSTKFAIVRIQSNPLEVAVVTFSDSDSVPVPKVLNPAPDPGPAIFQISESDSCSDSGCILRSNSNLPEVGPDPESTLAGFCVFLSHRDADPESKILEKPDPDPGHFSISAVAGV